MYHWLGNIRHIYWDMTAKGFNNATMLKTSYALFGATTLISLGLGVMTLPRRKEVARCSGRVAASAL